MLTDWNKYINDQKQVCQKLSVDFSPVDIELFVGLSDNINSMEKIIHGLRHPAEGKSSGWFIWAGDYSEAPDFFKPHCIKHLDKIKPEIIKYLALPSGHRFLIDNKGYEDIWADTTLLDI